MKQHDHISEIWYDLFLDLWNQRYKLEKQPREVLDKLAQQCGDARSYDDSSVIVTSLLLRARSDFAELDRAIRASGEITDEKARSSREEAERIFERWRDVLSTTPEPNAPAAT